MQRHIPSSNAREISGSGGFRDKIRNTFTKSGEIGVESGPDPMRRGGTLFGFRRNQRAGWQRAPGDEEGGGGDEWDAHDHLEELLYDAPPVKMTTREGAAPSKEQDANTAPPRPAHFRDPFEQQHQRSDSYESAETIVSPSSTLPGGTKFKEDL